MMLRHMTGAALVLTVFALVGTGMVAFTFDSTRETIAENERQALLQSLYTLIPAERLDNEIFSDVLLATDKQLLGTDKPVSIYRARKDGEPVAVVIASEAPDGYSGFIKLLVGINVDGTLAGVRAVAHKETPGLGDFIEEKKSNWILGFDNRSLGDPAPERWKVKKDGGDFDQATGATVTPRAVVKAVFNTLVYFERNRDSLFAKVRKEEHKDG